jgi:hypothetical protein
MKAEIILDKGNNRAWFYFTHSARGGGEPPFSKDKIIVQEGRLNNTEMTLKEITEEELTQVLDAYFQNSWNVYKNLH